MATDSNDYTDYLVEIARLKNEVAQLKTELAQAHIKIEALEDEVFEAKLDIVY